MSARRSGRTKAPVKYTSDSDSGSDFGASKKPRKPSTTTPKKRKQDASPVDSNTPKKRTKKNPATLAAEHTAKAEAQTAKATKQAHKEKWEEWVKQNDVEGKLLDTEPKKEESITQTDAGKKFGVKPEELGVLKHFEKRHPVYNNTTKLFVEEEVRELGFRKAGMVAGVEGSEEELLKRGEEIWNEEHKDDPKDNPKDESTPKTSNASTTPKKADKLKTPKQKWTAYVDSHTISSPDNLNDEPEESINQTDSKTRYSLTPGDLAVLPYFPKPNPKYGNTTKLFKESEVKTLAYRKAAYLGGADEGDDEVVLKKGKELFEESQNGE